MLIQRQRTKNKVGVLVVSYLIGSGGLLKIKSCFVLPNKMMIFVAPFLKFNPQNQPKYSTFVMFSSWID